MDGQNVVMKSEDSKANPVNINLDVAGFSKSISDSLKVALTDLLAKDKAKDVSVDVLADTVVAVVTGDLTKMQKSITDELQKTLADVQKEIDNKLASNAVGKGMDDAIEINGTIFQKSVVGEGAFAAIKASAIQSESLRKEIEHTKRISRVEKEYPNIAGKAEDKAMLLELIEKAATPVKEYGLQILKSLNNVGEDFKKEVGGSHAGGASSSSQTLSTDSDASMKLDSMSKELAQKDGITVHQAYSKVLATPEGAQLYDEHLANQQM